MKSSDADRDDATCIRSLKLDQCPGKQVDLCTDSPDQESVGFSRIWCRLKLSWSARAGAVPPPIMPSITIDDETVRECKS